MPHGWLLAAAIGLGWVLAALAAIDITTFRLPDLLTLPLAAAGLLVAWLSPVEDLKTHIVGAAVGYGVLAGLAWAYRRLRGRDGLGLGDAKLMAAAGAWLGWRPLPSVLLIACAAAFLWVGARLLLKGRAAASERIAFGAPLCLAIWIVWLYGPLGAFS
jgi:leader peptidase (prepilin peptidase)/N-methyltransferase